MRISTKDVVKAALLATVLYGMMYAGIYACVILDKIIR